MDHYKRMILMDMEAMLKDGSRTCLCSAFITSLQASFYGCDSGNLHIRAFDYSIFDLFPEFRPLSREILRLPAGDTYYLWNPVDSFYWWPYGQIAPRISTIQTYLRGNL